MYVKYDKYSRTPLFRSPKGNEKKFEIAGLRNNRGSVKGKGKSEGIRSSFEIARFDCISSWANTSVLIQPKYP